MSSSRPYSKVANGQGALRKPAWLTRLRSPRTWPLRTRLVVAQVALLAFVCVGIAAGTQLMLHKFLMDQLDDQVVDASHRSAVLYNLGPPPVPPPDHRRRGPGPDFLNAAGQQSQTVGAVISGGRVTEAAVITRTGSRETLTSTATEQLAQIPSDGRKVTINLDGLGGYRLRATHAHDGATVVTGLPTSGVEQTLVSAMIMFSVVAGLALLAATVAGILIMRRQLAPLSNVAATATEVAELDLDKGEVNLPTHIADVDPTDVHTEVGQLGAAFNRMLERIAGALSARHASETRLRQFVADASHELRTPLAAIRGYAELAQRNGDALPEDVAYAMSRVESEAHRMTQLVEDMLLLARLDAGRPLEQEPVDLSRLVVDAVNDGHIAGSDHRWELDLPDEPVIVVGDAARLHQVVANLLANCRTHTPPGTSVTTSLAAEDGWVELSVLDNGPGIPPEQQPDIFERFVRGDSSRSRRAGSTGLGLAIVSAVVRAHHGTIDVQSASGKTQFTVRLPASSRATSKNS
jgi:two-component system, OmpR family, sensor kinase